MKKDNFFKLISITKIFASALLISSFISQTIADEKILITINQFAAHPALDAALQGIEEAFKERNISDKIDLKISNAQGNIAITTQIAKHQAALSPRFMIAIATPAAQSLAKNLKSNCTLAFVAVTNPEAAGIKELPNIIGVADQPPIEKLLEIVSQIMPQARKVGVIYNQGEVNSTHMVEHIKKIAPTKNLQVIESALTSSSNARQAAQKLIGNVDFIYIPQDNLVVSSLDNIISITSKANIPVVSNDPSLNDKGLLLSYGADYFKSGKQLGNMIADLIKDKKLINNIQSSSNMQLQINEAVVEKLNIIIPAGIK